MKRILQRSMALCAAIILTLSIAGCNQASKAEINNQESSAISSGSEEASQTSRIGNGVVFSQSGGLYESAFALALSTDMENGVIRYTLDGSDPTSESAQYTEPVTIADRSGEDNLLSVIVSGGSGGRGDFGGGGNNNGAGMPPEMPEDGFPNGRTAPPDTDADEAAGNRIPAMDSANQTGGMGPGGPGGSSAASAPAENVFKGTVVKAAVFSEDGTMLSDVSVQSYFVSEDIFTRYGELPIVSIVTDADNFFDEETGIYVNYNQSGSDWERPVYFEMFEADGTAVISQDMGARINGGTTRSLAQKALRFYAKDDYDEANPTIECELFDGLTTSYSDDPLTTFNRIILRSSGNDNSGSLFRDALMQFLVSDLNVDTQASRPCVAFVNGEFWGIYNIRERYDDYYFANHYDIDKDNVAFLEISNGSSTPEMNEGDESDLAYYNEMWSFFDENSMTDEANYQKAQEYLDIDNFIDYYVANIYSGNTDWPGNNNAFWRYKTANGGYDDTAEWYMDGRFRWVMKDMDWGFGLMTNQTSDTLSHAMNESTSGSSERGDGGGFTSAETTLMFRKLLENEDFQAKFINRFCDVMNTNYDADMVIATINEMRAEIEVAIAEQSNRYPGSVSSVESWESSIDKMIRFAEERAGYMREFLQSKFSLADIATVTLQTDGEAGYIRINNTDITTDTRGISNASSWSGSYFAGTTQTFNAVSLEGHAFVKFLVTDIADGTTTEYADGTIEITVGSGGTTVQAIFE